MKVIRRIIAMILIIFTILTSPLAGYFNIENNAYGSAAEFTATLESDLFKHAIIPILISSGLVFKSKQAIDRTVSDTIEWLNDQGFDWKDPDDPDGPNLSEILKTMLKGTIIWSAVDQLYKDVIKIPDVIRDLIKHFVDENYDEGEIIEGKFERDGDYYVLSLPLGDDIGDVYFYTSENEVYVCKRFSSYARLYYGGTYYEITNPIRFKLGDGKTDFRRRSTGAYTLPFILVSIELLGKMYTVDGSPTGVEGVENVIDNQNYDWNNNYTNEKHIPIPIKTDIHGNPVLDENGFYLPITTEPDIWIDVQPDEIPELDPSGIPQVLPEDLPNVPDNPDEEDEDGKILVFLKNIFNKITGIRNDTATIVEKMPDTSTSGTGGTGGIDTSIPTGFEWGDFRRFFDVIFIFIYFIVILILILLKFLEIVFFNLVAIPANADLFNQYPAILSGINYIKNLQVGGLSITVHQAFEYVFLIFFFIFIIKQIRKLYGAFVLEENERERDARRDMKMDYYDKNNNVR